MNKKTSIILLTITVMSLIVAGYFYNEVKRLQANPQTVANQELQAVVDKVGKLVVLPEGEQPTLAKKGDKVLVYNKAQKAILYDPVLNKIVEIAPITN